MARPFPWLAVHPALRLVRFGNTLVSFAGVIVGGLVARGAGVQIPPSFALVLLLAAASSALVTAGGNVLNDILDRESDRLNHPDRPLVTGAISVPTARWMSGGFLAASALVILPVALAQPWLPVLLAVALTALLSYEFHYKSRGFPGNLLVALLTGLVFLYGGAAANAPLLLLPFAGMAIAATLSRELIKDMEDAGGDLDRRTLPQTRGFPVATVLARLSVAAAIALSPVPVFSFLSAGSAAGIIYLALVLAADALFVVSVARLPADLHRGQTISKGAMTVALLAFLSVAFR